MKKSVLFLFCICMLFLPMNIHAEDNDMDDAYKLTLDTSLSVKYVMDDNDYSKWFKYSASSSSYYEFSASNTKDLDLTLTIYDSNGTLVESGDTDITSGKCIVAAKLEKGETYYLECNCYAYEDVTVRVKVSKHTHTYEYDGILKNKYGEKRCKYCDYFTTGSMSVSVSTTSYTYNGNDRKPTVKVIVCGDTLSKSKYYSAYYDANMKSVGKHTIEIVFEGDASSIDTIYKYYTILPMSTSFSSVDKDSNSISLVWNKVSKECTGYQIEYSTSSTFSSGKLINISSYKTTKKTISKLKSSKKYYVRIRTYKTVNKTKYYSKWGRTRTVTTKSA